MKKLIIAILLSSMIALSACGGEEDEENSLTSPSTSGKGTISLLLNGDVWRPETEFNFPHTLLSHGMRIEPQNVDSSGNKTNDLVKITIGANRKKGNEDLEFFVEDVFESGVYQIKKARFWLNKETFLIDTLMYERNYIEITNISKDYSDAYYDTLSNKIINGRYSKNTIVSGKFEIHLVSNSGQKIQITQGRFDLKNQGYSDY
ncbi:MAG: hypothetical protein CVV22_05420 [Ignavibacteriae bacterium HGW-Ignavibacteriae-1]|jgi:hypothetical protein|nr:MAG: hypothetical protein CVV22_05420 [Ignavibacteriae bacterium HGW-Ignavibacteriae-1]